MLAVASEHLFGDSSVTLPIYHLVGRFHNATRGLPSLRGAVCMYISERDGFTLLVCGVFCWSQVVACVVVDCVGS